MGAQRPPTVTYPIQDNPQLLLANVSAVHPRATLLHVRRRCASNVPVQRTCFPRQTCVAWRPLFLPPSLESSSACTSFAGTPRSLRPPVVSDVDDVNPPVWSEPIVPSPSTSILLIWSHAQSATNALSPPYAGGVVPFPSILLHSGLGRAAASLCRVRRY